MKSIAQKNKLFIKLQKRFYAAAFNDYKKYRNFLNRVIKSAKQNHSNEAAKVNKKAVAILPSTAIYPQRLFCRELFVIGQS